MSGNGVEANFSYSRTIRVAALATALIGILFLTSQLASMSFLYGSIPMSIGGGKLQMPLPIIACYMSGFFVFVMLWEFFRFLRRSNPNSTWKINPFMQIFGVAVMVATFAFFFCKLLFDTSHHGVVNYAATQHVGILISIELLFSWIMGIVVFVLLLEAMSDLEKQATTKK